MAGWSPWESLRQEPWSARAARARSVVMARAAWCAQGPRSARRREVVQPGVLGDPDPVLTTCPAVVTQFQVNELPDLGVGHVL